MTEIPSYEPSTALFARIQEMVNERGLDIRQHLSGNALRLEFADGECILIKLDQQTLNLWLASRSGGVEFVHRNNTWLSLNNREFFSKLNEDIEATIVSNLINARTPITQLPQPTPRDPIIRRTAKKNHGLRNALILLLIMIVGFWTSQKMFHPHQTTIPPVTPKTQTLSLNKLHYQCTGGFPFNGSITVFPDGNLSTDGPKDSEITLKNNHAFPVLTILSKPESAIPALSILVHSKQKSTLHLPAGQYDMMFSVGITWCNPRSGFSEGHLLKFDKPLIVQSDKAMQLTMQTTGPGMEDFQLFIKTGITEIALPPPTFTGDGSMEVQRQSNGHFYLPGAINTIPVTFMVDTGTSVTSISSELARQSGIRNCKEVQFQTANGTATGCIALLPHMSLGNFVLENITVAVMPNLDSNLLGANVLRNFQVHQSESSMLIRRRSSKE